MALMRAYQQTLRMPLPTIAVCGDDEARVEKFYVTDSMLWLVTPYALEISRVKFDKEKKVALTYCSI